MPCSSQMSSEPRAFNTALPAVQLVDRYFCLVGAVMPTVYRNLGSAGSAGDLRNKALPLSKWRIDAAFVDRVGHRQREQLKLEAAIRTDFAIYLLSREQSGGNHADDHRGADRGQYRRQRTDPIG